MSRVGELMKDKREQMKLTLDDISARTAIRKHILAAIEEGRFAEMPSYVHAHGFLEQYTKTLGLDFTNVVKPLFDEECNKEHFGKTPEEVLIEKEQKPKPAPVPARLKVAIIGIIALLAVAGFAVSNLKKDTKPVDPIDIPVNTPVNTPLTTNNQTVTPDPVYNSAYVDLDKIDNKTNQTVAIPVMQTAEIKFSEDCWFKLTIDDNEPVEFTATPNYTRTISFTKGFSMDVGNAIALKVIYKDQIFSNFGGQDVPMRNNFFYLTDSKMEYSRRRPAQ